ncbi:hypothetical protein BKA62DRAFT_751629 [Auriculariales sp. MPI-PUGE-AT-0066]|nr:hypothetical protein BKA62DRAFT_751629 [Auriculariales sp. MPI-PUGE-AT-0066]
MHFTRAVASLALLFLTVRGHGAITQVKGANGVNAAAFGIDASTPRDGTRARPFQQDTSIIRDREIARGTASACGRTRLGGVNDIAAQMAAASSDGLPSATTAGEVEMTLHQINGDGAGPYTCDVNTDGTGNAFTPMQVTTQVPGNNGRSRARAEDFPLVAQMPAGTTCTGGPDGNACLVRCRNPARAGPFGGCVAVTMGDAAATNAGGNATDTTAAGTADAETAAAEAAEAAEDDGTPKRKRVVKSRIISRELAGQWI